MMFRGLSLLFLWLALSSAYSFHHGDRCSSYLSCASCTESRYPSSERQRIRNELQRSLQEESVQAGNPSDSNKLNRAPTFSSNVHRRQRCLWCPVGKFCFSSQEQDIHNAICWNSTTNASLALRYEYNCPLGPTPYPDDTPPTLLPDWMGQFFQRGWLENVTLLDLCLPGTHDSLSYDLSLTVSQEGLDGLHRLSDLLHALSGGSMDLLPGELEEFFRLQGKTQQLTLSQQLDNGIRFIDMRIMVERDSSTSTSSNNNTNRWYSMHFMQSNHEVAHYLQELKEWLEQHDNEIVVVWLSKQGDTGATGNNQYPNVSPEDKHRFWLSYVSMMNGLLFDARTSDIHTTPLAELIRRNHRLITFCSDYDEFTQPAPHLALDARRIQNTYDVNGVFYEPQSLESHLEYFRHGAAHNDAVHRQSGFTLLAMNTAGTSWQITHAAIRRFLPWVTDKVVLEYVHKIQNAVGENGGPAASLFKSCASHMNIPGVTKWCPPILLDIAQLSSYYNQIVLESAFANTTLDKGIAFPNALYLDALDYNGTMRIGTQLLDGSERDLKPSNNTNAAAQYAYVDTILAYNVEQICQRMMHVHLSNAWSRRSLETSLSQRRLECESVKAEIRRRRERYPLIRWEQPEFGRHVSWPPQSLIG